ncbi:MAG: hypothetical protein A2W80_11470 [Candidatus Riflebacteria bacterium GWC2_50_8]|nr:MAG: hypothetical protein A2W80_11470 [Candidatus Riflebacteria bacterium GWC2_50_8]
MKIYPEIRFGQDKVNDRLVIDFGAERSFLATLPLWLLLPAGYCFMMTIMPSEQQGIFGMAHGIFLLVLALVLTAIAQYYFVDRVIFDRKSQEIWQETRCGRFSRQAFRLSFAEVAGIGLSGKKVAADYGSYLEFKIVLVSQAGAVIPVSLGFREDRQKHYVEIARTISYFIGSEFVEPNPRLPRLVLEDSGQQIYITYRVAKIG